MTQPLHQCDLTLTPGTESTSYSDGARTGGWLAHWLKISILLCAAGFVVGLTLSPPVLAHDFWLTGERTDTERAPVLRMWAGHLLGHPTERPYEAQRSLTLRVYQGELALPLPSPGTDGGMPFYVMPHKLRLPVLVGLERPEIIMTLPAEEFDSYLTEEHLGDILAMRQEGAGPVTERYSRYIKLLVGPHLRGTKPPRRIGQQLEIVVEKIPKRPGKGKRLRARVLFQGEPLSGRTVTALAKELDADPDGAGHTATAETDEHGRVSFDYEHNGVWMLRLVHMRPCKDCAEADWESFWAAYVIQPDWIVEQVN